MNKDSETRITATICCIARHESQYLQEWIDYNLYLGFDCIQIHDNSTDHCLKDLPLAFNGKVEVVHFPGETMQYPAYNDLLKRSKERFTFAAFIDVDEFFVLRNDKTIHDFLTRHNPATGIAVNWVFFGSNFQDANDGSPVLERFVRRQNGVNSHVKCIVRLSQVDEYSLSHFPTKKNGSIVDAKGHVVEGAHNHLGDDQDIALFHYWGKSKEEFDLKGSRPRPDMKQNRDGSSEAFGWYNSLANVTTDYSALKFYLDHCGTPERLDKIIAHEETTEKVQASGYLKWAAGRIKHLEAAVNYIESELLKEVSRLNTQIHHLIHENTQLKSAAPVQSSPSYDKSELDEELAGLKAQMALKDKELEHLRSTVESAYAWQRKSWFHRATKRWKGAKRKAV